jgi:hypothetical protein
MPRLLVVTGLIHLLGRYPTEAEALATFATSPTDA